MSDEHLADGLHGDAGEVDEDGRQGQGEEDAQLVAPVRHHFIRALFGVARTQLAHAHDAHVHFVMRA